MVVGVAAMTTTPELLAFLRTYPGRCPDCGAHIRTQGRNGGCLSTGQRLAAQGMARTTSAHPSAVEIIDAAIARRIAGGKPFSANDLRGELTHLTPEERPVIGARINAHRNKMRALGEEKSTDPGTHGKKVTIWLAHPDLPAAQHSQEASA